MPRDRSAPYGRFAARRPGSTMLKSRTLALALGAFSLSFPSFASAITIERTFSVSADRVRVVQEGGLSQVQVDRALPEFRAGHPDLPWIGEPLEVPSGYRATAIEVLSIDTERLGERVMLPSAIRPEPGAGPVVRTEPDRALFSRAGFQPESPARLGLQGSMRGKNIVYVQWCPARWDASNGMLERVSSVRVRLTLEPGFPEPLRRDRIVPEWENLRPVRDRAGVISIESSPGAGNRGPQPFRATQVPSVLGSPVRYLIITSDEMAAEYQRLADWKTESGFPAVVRTVSFIRQNYPGAADDAERIRMFIADAYSRWGTQFVLLGGDTPVIPVRYAYTTYYGGENIASDVYYSCLDGNWNADGDSTFGEGYFNANFLGDFADILPEVYVGRAPTTTLADAQWFVTKTLQFAQNPVGDYENSVLFFAEVLFPQPWAFPQPVALDGGQLAQEALPYLDANPNMRYARLYQNHTPPAYAPNCLPLSKAAVIDSLNDGYGMAVHIGHGYRNIVSVGDGNLVDEDVLNLTNGNRLFHLYAINCTSNAIDFPCIGESFLHATNGGAITNVGSSRFDFPVAGRYFEEEYFRLVFEDSVSTVGIAQAMQKYPFQGDSQVDGLSRWTTLTLLLLGDPQLPIFTARPKTLSVTHAGALNLSDSTVTVTVQKGGSPLYGAQVTLYKAGDEYRTGTTDGAGQVVLPFRPDATGSVKLTVTAYDCRPYRATVPINAAGDPVLADLTPVVDDDDISGTQGNADAGFNAGEIIDLTIPVKNNGGSQANSVTGTLSTTDGQVTISSPVVNYGDIAAGATSSPGAKFRLSLPGTLQDQREIPLTLTLTDAGGRVWREVLPQVSRSPDLFHLSHVVVDAGGNNDQRPDAGENVTMQIRLRNAGTGIGYQLAGVLRIVSGIASITDSLVSWGTMTPNQEVTGDAVVFTPSAANAKLELRVSDRYGLLWVHRFDTGYPVAPIALQSFGLSGSIRLGWGKSTSADLYGYNVYRGNLPGGPFAKRNLMPTRRSATYMDDQLPPLTVYHYYVTAVDSSGNESTPSAVVPGTTTAAYHPGFPQNTSWSTSAPVTVAHMTDGYGLDILVGSRVVYAWHTDGTAPVDADGQGATNGDFTTLGGTYQGGASVGDIDADGFPEVVATCEDPDATSPPTAVMANRVFAFERNGQIIPGWPLQTSNSVWSSAALGDLDNDGDLEIATSSFANKLYLFTANGGEWLDGDANPTTHGVFKVMFDNFNLGTPAIGDVDANGIRDIVFGSFDRRVYALRPDGSNLPGFPKLLPVPITASVALGYLDGGLDTDMDIVVATGHYSGGPSPDSLYVFRSNGTLRAGWPKAVVGSGSLKCPSPALGDMNSDGFVDIVFAGTNGLLYVYDRNGVAIAPIHGVTYSSLPSAASESSPVIGDIDGDGLNDVLMGDENGVLSAIGGTGIAVPGFPITLEGEIKSPPAMCDCDLDGMTEVVAMTSDGTVHLWDYDRTFSPGQTPPWPQFHHDAQRTGLLPQPDQTAGGGHEGHVPLAVEFSPGFPNPAGTRTVLEYAIPTDRAGERVELAVYDLSGRLVRVLARGAASPGHHRIAWDLRRGNGGKVEGGVYFTMLQIGAERHTRKLVVLP